MKNIDIKDSLHNYIGSKPEYESMFYIHPISLWKFLRTVSQVCFKILEILETYCTLFLALIEGSGPLTPLELEN